MKSIIDVKEEDYYSCDRCGITSLTKGRSCPCPRGGCDAIIVGTIKTTTELDTKLSKEQEDWNKNH